MIDNWTEMEFYVGIGEHKRRPRKRLPLGHLAESMGDGDFDRNKHKLRKELAQLLIDDDLNLHIWRITLIATREP